MYSATPRAQLHMQRVLEKSGIAASNGSYGSVSAASDYGAAETPGTHCAPNGQPDVHRGSSGRALTPSNINRSASVMSIVRDGRSASTPYPNRQNGGLGNGTAPTHDGTDQTGHEAGHCGQSDSCDPEHPGQARGIAGGDGHGDPNGSEIVNGRPAPEGSGRYSDDDGYVNEHTPRSPGDYTPGGVGGGANAPRSSVRGAGGAAGAGTGGYGPDGEGAPMHAAARGDTHSDSPQTIYDADGNPVCDIVIDENGSPVTVTYDEEGNAVYGDPESSLVPASVLRELLTQREETRRLAEERDEIRARLEELEGRQGTGTPLTGGDGNSGGGDLPTYATHGGSGSGRNTPDNSGSQLNRYSHLLISLPEESAINRGNATPRGGAVLGTLRSGPWTPDGKVAWANNDNVLYYNPDEAYEHPDEVEYAETTARRRITAAADETYLAILEKADENVRVLRDTQQTSVVSFARRNSDTSLLQAGSTPNSHDLVPSEQVIVAIQQEKEIGELREALAEAEEKIAKLEETNTALRLQLVLEKSNRK